MSGIIGVSGTRSGIIGDTNISTSAWTSWTPTVVGFTGTPTVYGKYRRFGKLVYVIFDVTGTSSGSDGDTFIITNLPIAPYAVTNYDQPLSVGTCQDNSSNTGLGTVNIYADDGKCYCRLGGAYDGWTKSGTKNIMVSGVYQSYTI